MRDDIEKLLHPDFWRPGIKPRGQVEVDWDNPITAGLQWVRDPTGVFSYRFTPNIVGSPVNGVHAGGPGVYFSSTAAQYATESLITGTNPASFLCVCQIVTDSGNNLPLSVLGNNRAAWDGWYFNVTGGSSVSFNDANNAAFGAATATYPYAGKVLALAGASNSSNRRAVAVNGVLATGTTALGSKALTNQQPEFNGISIGNPFDGYIYCGAGWNRQLSDAEILSLSRDPYQVLRPAVRSTWIPVSAAGSDLSGNASASATGAGTLTTAIPIYGAAISVAQATGGLSTSIPLAGAAASLTSSGGQLSAQIVLTGDALAQTVASAGLSSGIILTAGSVAQAAASGTLSTLIQLIASAQAQASASGSLTTGGAGPLAGNAAANTAASGVLTAQIQFSAAAVAQAAAAAGLSTGVTLSGAAAGQAAGSGVLTANIELTASALAQAIASGALTTNISLTSQALVTAIAHGGMDTEIHLAANAAAQAQAGAALSGVAAVILGGGEILMAASRTRMVRAAPRTRLVVSRRH